MSDTIGQGGSALARLRAKRAAASSMNNVDEGDNTISPSRNIKTNNLDVDSSSSSNKRSDLKKLREKARAEESSSSAIGNSEKTNSKNKLSLRQRLANRSAGGISSDKQDVSDDDDDDDDDDNDKDDIENDGTAANGKTKLDEASDDAEESITRLELPPRVFPLSFAPQSRFQ